MPHEIEHYQVRFGAICPCHTPERRPSDARASEECGSCTERKIDDRTGFLEGILFAWAHSGTVVVQVGLAVLGIAFLVEGYSLWVALEECRAEAKKAQLSLRNYIMEGSDAMNVAVLMEDGVAVSNVCRGDGCRGDVCVCLFTHTLVLPKAHCAQSSLLRELTCPRAYRPESLLRQMVLGRGLWDCRGVPVRVRGHRQSGL